MEDKWFALMIVGIWLGVGMGTAALAFCSLPACASITGIGYLCAGGSVVSGIAVCGRFVLPAIK